MVIFFYQDVAEVALHRCVHREYEVNDKGSCEVTRIEYSYEFLDDFITPEPSMSTFVNMLSWKKKEQADELMTSNSTHDIPLSPVPTVQGPPYIAVTSQEDWTVESAIGGSEGQESWLQEQYDPSNHPLELMVCVFMCKFKLIVV